MRLRKNSMKRHKAALAHEGTRSRKSGARTTQWLSGLLCCEEGGAGGSIFPGPAGLLGS